MSVDVEARNLLRELDLWDAFPATAEQREARKLSEIKAVLSNLDERVAALAAENAALQARVEGEWRDIATAPVNQAVQVLVPGAYYYGNQGVYAAMLVSMGTGPRWMTFAWACGRDLPADGQPTKWRPLPAPPAGEAM